MENYLSLSELSEQISDVVESCFSDQIYWIKAEITDVKKYPSKKWCFLTLIEKDGEQITAKLRANMWMTGYSALVRFEKSTKQIFEDGLEILCAATVKYHPVYGMSAEIIDIYAEVAQGKNASDKEAVFQQLLKDYPDTIQIIDEDVVTLNNQLATSSLIRKIALIAAVNSDGYRDFMKELQENVYGYQYKVDEYSVTVQGESAEQEMIHALSKIKKDQYDIVVIVRGGGSELDFMPFNQYELCAAVAHFHTPIWTGIGHDRNTSLVDLMATQFKTPTKVANRIVETTYLAEQEIIHYAEKIQISARRLLDQEHQWLRYTRKIIEGAAPSKWLAKGLAIIRQGDQIKSSIQDLDMNELLSVELYDGEVKTKIINHEQ